MTKMGKGTEVELLREAEQDVKIEGGDSSITDGKKNGRTLVLSVFCVCLLLIDVLLLGLVIFLFTTHSKETNVCNEPSEFCIPCNAIRLSPGEDKTNFAIFGYARVDEGRDGDCCAGNGHNLQKLLELFVERKQRLNHLQNIQDRERKNPVTSFGGLQRSKPAVHLIGHEIPITMTTEDGVLKTVLWEKQQHPAFVHGNVTVNKKMITVSVAGYYYIYTQVIFERHNNVTGDRLDAGDVNVPNKMCHFLFRSNGQGTDPNLYKLLENSQSGYTSLDEKSSTYSSYIGAVFYLHEQDAVLVKVTNPDMVKPNRHGNFFGLYMV